MDSENLQIMLIPHFSLVSVKYSSHFWDPPWQVVQSIPSIQPRNFVVREVASPGWVRDRHLPCFVGNMNENDDDAMIFWKIIEEKKPMFIQTHYQYFDICAGWGMTYHFRCCWWNDWKTVHRLSDPACWRSGLLTSVKDCLIDITEVLPDLPMVDVILGLHTFLLYPYVYMAKMSLGYLRTIDQSC